MSIAFFVENLVSEVNPETINWGHISPSISLEDGTVGLVTYITSRQEGYEHILSLRVSLGKVFSSMEDLYLWYDSTGGLIIKGIGSTVGDVKCLDNKGMKLGGITYLAPSSEVSQSRTKGPALYLGALEFDLEFRSRN